MGLYSDAVLADSPLLYWRLGERSGTNANDETANNRDGTYVGSPTLGGAGALATDGGTSVAFSGTGQYVSSSYALTQGSSYTFEAWVKRTNQSAAHTIIATDGSGAPMLARMAASDQLDFHSQAGSSVSWASSGIGTGSWRHMVITFDNANDRAALWINGAIVSDQSFAGEFQATPGNFTAGAWSEMRFDPWNGSLDEIAVYSGVLPASRIRAHYMAGRPRSRVAAAILDTPGLSAYWPLGSNESTALEVSGAGTPLTGTYTGAIPRGPIILPSGEPNQPGDPYGSTYFDGSGDYMSVADNSRLDATASGLTVMAWIQPTALPANAAWATVWSKIQAGTSEYWFQLYDDTGGLEHGYTTGGTSVLPSSNNDYGQFLANVPYHVAVAYKTDNTADLFVNGTLAWRVSGSVSISTSNTAAFYLGGWNGASDWFTGYIAHSAVFDRALAQADIVRIFEAGCERNVVDASLRRPDYDRDVRGLSPLHLWTMSDTDTRDGVSITDSIGAITMEATGPNGVGRGMPSAQPGPPGTNLNSIVIGRGHGWGWTYDDADTLTATYTVECVVRGKELTSANWRAFADKGGSPGGTYRRSWLIGYNNETPGKLMWSVGTAGSSGTSFADITMAAHTTPGLWYHVVGVAGSGAGTTTELWVNGQQIGTSTATGGPYVALADEAYIGIGTGHWDTLFCEVAHFAFYGYCLSGPQIQAHHRLLMAGLKEPSRLLARNVRLLSNTGSLNSLGMESGEAALESWIAERPDAPPDRVVAQAVQRAAVM